MNERKRIPPLSNRDRVIGTAAALFLRQGYAYTSMDEIMHASNVSKSNIYYHFKSKEELLGSVLVYWMGQYEQLLGSLLERTDLTVEERVVAFVDAVSQQHEQCDVQVGCPFMSLFMQSPLDAVQVRQQIGQFFAQQLPLFERMFEQARASGEIAGHHHPYGLAVVLLSAIEGALLLGDTEPSLPRVRHTVAHFFQLLR